MDIESKHKAFSPFSTILVFVALMIIGFAMMPLLNIQLSPSRTTCSISVDYYWPGASARNIEQEVTSRLENMFSVMTGLNQITSVSRHGSGQITMSFKKSVDPDAARFEAATIIRRVYPQLPEDVSYPQISVGTGGNKTVTVLIYTLAAGTEPFFIKQYAEENIAPKIALVPGVNEVGVYGASPYKYEIIFDLTKSRTLGVNGNDIANAVNNYFSKDLVGIAQSGIDKKEFTEEFRVSFQTSTGESPDWDNIPVKNDRGRIIYLSDLAHVVYKEEEPVSYYRINGLNTINLVINAGEGVNNIRLAKEVKTEIQKIRQALPSGYSVILAYDATRYLNDELIKIGLRTLFSILILLAFVWIISRKLRYLFFIASSLLANLVIAVIFYHLLRLEIHLYSLAGITVSFGIIIDNTIVMIDHYRYHRNKKVFLAIFAATLTTIGSLCVIFFLDEQQQINLIDFTWVMIVNLGVSLIIALFFIPALQDMAPLISDKNKIFFRRKRRINRMSGVYINVIRFSKQWKWAFIILFILGFGIPVHWLPDRINKENRLAELYNRTAGSEFYQRVRPVFEKIVGGSLRLFSENVYERSFYSDPQRTTLYVRGSMPEGCTVHQLNEAIKIMENHLGGFDEIEMYRTTVSDYNNSNITIYFKPEFEYGSFPYFLKEELISRAISIGGADWSVYGVGQGFSNAIYTGYKSNEMELTGYNYEQLYKYAEILCDSLDKYPRVQELEISGERRWQAKTLHEFVINFDREALAMQDITLNDYYSYLRDDAYKQEITHVYNHGEKTPVTLVSDKSASFDKWKLNNEPVRTRDVITKFASVGSIEKRKTGSNIYKYNQEYRLYVLFNYIGSYKLAQRLTDNLAKSINNWLPMGYKISGDDQGYYWLKQDKKQYYLIFLVIAIIYFLCAILLESLLQPLAIIAMIPVSFTGVFITFYLFGFNFDQGGFASFIFLCGLSVNAALYIINDYNIFIRQKPAVPKLKVYIRAFNHKIIPVILTILSTVLGLIPFVIGGQNEVFWFAFAAGTIGGLVFSLIALYIYFPLFLKLNVSKQDIK
jgi:multidrug efflux pump subunit AcrB